MNNYENINEGVSRLGCKGTEFSGSGQQIRAIPEEIAPYFLLLSTDFRATYTRLRHR